MSLANYGSVPYGKSILGHVYISDPLDACSDLKSVNLSQYEKAPIILAKRGNCHFVTKSRNA